MKPLQKLQQFKRSNWISRLALPIALLLSMTGCQTTTNSCPLFPPHDKYVGQELKLACWTQDTHNDLCPHLHEWLGRVHVLEKQLGVQ